MKLIFIGTPEFGAIILNRLIEGGYVPILVITAKDKPVGRKKIITPPPVKELARRNKIAVLQPEKIEDAKDEIKKIDPDIIIVAAYIQKIPKDILDIPSLGCLNVHPSLLPKYRGPSPIHYTILNGEKETGVTIILMDEELDHGPILSQKTLQIEYKETTKTLYDKLADLGGELLTETISQWRRKLIEPKPQNHKETTQTKILIKEGGKIDWNKKAEDIEREIRAYLPWPGSYSFWEKGEKSNKIDILKARVYKPQVPTSYPIGKALVVPQNEIGIQCGKGDDSETAGDFLVIERLRMEGGKEMIADEFIRGHQDLIGSILK